MRIRWSEKFDPGAWVAPGRGILKGPRAFALHDHDFAEVFWIESGRATHLINGKRLPLEAGDGVFVRPRDRHGFASDAEGFVICNAPTRASYWRELRRRYFRTEQSGWDPSGAMPRVFRLSAEGLRRMRTAFEDLALRPDSQIETDRFFLNLWHELRAGSPAAIPRAAPRWLAEACRRFEDPRWLSGGTTTLARLAGRCPEHVARVMRRTCGKTPTDLVNAARLRYAAQQLLVSDRGILDISLECGFSSLAHFYTLFSKKFRMTPRQYRLRHSLADIPSAPG